MAEETIKFNVEYDIRGIDQTIRSSQRLLYFVNSIRLTIVDLQKVLKEPTLENVFWTTLQLTYVWTNLIRLIKQANTAAAGGNALNFLGLAGGGRAAAKGLGLGAAGWTSSASAWGGTGIGSWAASGAGGYAAGVAGRATGGLLMSALIAMGAISPVGWAIIGTAAVIGAYELIQGSNRSRYENYLQRQRTIAKSQGLEY